MKASAFIEKLFGGRTRGSVFLATYANDRSEAGKFPPRDLVTRDWAKVDKFVTQYDVAGRACYFAVNTFSGKKRSKDTVDEINALHLDIDFSGVVQNRAQIEDVLKNIDCQPSAVVFSGHGLHCYWLLQPALQGHQQANVERLLRRLCEMLAGDVSTAEVARVMRLPGSHNSKRGEWVEVEVLPKLCSWRTYSLAKLDRWMDGQDPLLTYKAKKKETVATAPTRSDLNIWQQFRRDMRSRNHRADIKELLDNMEYKGVMGNAINTVRSDVVGMMVHDGATLDEVIDTLLAPSREAYMASPLADKSAWTDKEEIKLITEKFKYYTKRDQEKEQQASELGAGVSEAVEQTSEPKKMNGTNGHKHHDFDDGDPSDRIDTWGKPNMDLFTAFVVPKMKPEYLPELIANVAFSNAPAMNGDPGALAMSLMTAASAMIATDVKIKVRAQEHSTWLESARVWTVLVGDPGSTKSPLMRAAIAPVTAIDFKLGRDFQQADAEYKAMTAEEKRETDKPVRNTYILNNISIESGADTMFDNPQGLLFFSDEYRALIGTATKYVNKGNSGAEHTSKAFLLSAYNSEYAKVTRIGRGEKFGYPSISMLGSIQPDLLHRLSAAAEDNDGFLQRMTPVFINNDEALGAISDDDPDYPFELYNGLIDRMYHSPLKHGAVIKFSTKAQPAMDRMLEYCRVQYNLNRTSEPALATAYRKIEAMFARWCLIYHMIEHPDARHPGVISPETAKKVTRLFHEYLEPHIVQLHKMSSLNDEHKKLRSIVMYALAHKLDELTNRDLQRGSNQLREIDTRDMRRFMAKLEALNYGRVLARAKGSKYDSLAFQMNPNVRRLLRDKVKEEEQRLTDERIKFDALKQNWKDLDDAPSNTWKH